MKRLVVGAFVLAAAACGQAEKVATPPAASPAVTPSAASAAPATAVDVSLPVAMAGRWGETPAACAPDNHDQKGVFEIGPSNVTMGLDACRVTRKEPEGEGLHLVVVCHSGAGGADYERDFSFSTPAPGKLRWTSEGGEAHDYARCP